MNRPLKDLPDQALLDGHAMAIAIIRATVNENDLAQAEVLAVGAVGLAAEMLARSMIDELEFATVQLATARALGRLVS